MGENLKEQLFNKKENGWNSLNEEERKEVFRVSKNYMDFLNVSKTEREVIKNARYYGI